MRSTTNESATASTDAQVAQADGWLFENSKGERGTSLYEHPPRGVVAKWPLYRHAETSERKPLTYMEIFHLSCAIPLDTDDHDVALARAIEQHHGIGSDK